MKYLLLPVVLLLVCAFTMAKKKKDRSILRFSDCGTDPQRPIRIRYVRISPMPVVIPGTLYLSMGGTLTHDLPRRLTIDLSVTKYIFKMSFELPCFDSRVGSCVYENVCNSLEKYQIFGCPKGLTDKNIRCHCPFLAGDFQIDKVPLNIPKLNGLAGAFINGNYKLQMRILGDQREELGCLEMKFSVRKRHKGWFFKI